jgi:hypothetical protein
MATVSQLLDEHVTLTVESLDRIYLNGYVPSLQTSGQLVSFLTQHRGNPIPSPALLKKIGDQFLTHLDQFLLQHRLTTTHFERKQRKDDVAAEQRQKFNSAEGVYMIGVAQEKSNSFKGSTRRDAQTGLVSVAFSRQSVCVNQYYFYLVDKDFGPAFIKVSSYAPYGLRICLNGHEWAKRQAEKAGLSFEALDNGFASCSDPKRLQEICDSLGPQQIIEFLNRWLNILPLPLTANDRDAGYGYRLSVWQVEASRTQVFEAPVHGREFFEEVVRENIDLGRPDRVSLVFDRKITKATPGTLRTRVIQDGVHPSLHFEYKSCHVKQYFKENRALRTETTINSPDDFYVGRDISHLPELARIGHDINRRLLEVERVSQECTLSQSTLEKIVQPTVTQDGKRVPALRFGDHRPMALWSGLTLMCHLPQGFTNASLRQHVADLLGPGSCYRASQMTYDLRRLRRKNLIQRVKRTNRYTLTALGLRVACFFSKLEQRIFKTASACVAQPDGIQRNLADAFASIENAINQLVSTAKLQPA